MKAISLSKYLMKAAVLPALLALSACNGGGGTSGTSTGISQGATTGFGSVYINGVKFNTDGTAFTVDDSTGTGAAGQLNLKLGMVATVAWSRDDSGKYTASTIKYSSDVQGLATAIDATAGTLTVFGQAVRVSAQTVFQGDGTTSVTSLATLPSNRFVEVSGLKDAAGVIQATRIELKATGTTEYELKGIVSASGVTTFTVGSQVVNSTLAPSVGACVEVKGTVLTAGVLTATIAKFDDSCTLGGGLSSTSTAEVELEGYISDFTAGGTTFKVNGQAVRVTSATLYDDKGVGATITTLVNGNRIEVEGKMSSGVLVATKVSLDPELSDRLESSIEMEVPSGGAVQVSGSTTTMTVFGSITVTVNDSTRFEDGIPRNLSDINTRSLEIDAYPVGTTVIATRIRVKNASRPLLQGPAKNVTGTSSLTILGVVVTPAIGVQYRDINGATINASTFYAQAVNAVVKVKGSSISGGLMTATELEIED